MKVYFFELHLAWFLFYMFILIILFYGTEMYGVGAPKPWSFTENTCAVAERVNWYGVLFMLFLTWIWIHFAIRIIPLLFNLPPKHWI